MSWKAKAISSTETCRHPTWLLEHVKAGLNPLMSHLSYSPESLNDVEDVSGRRLIVTYDFEILWGCWGSEFKVFQRVSIHFLWHVAAMWIGLMTSTGWWSLVCFPKLDDQWRRFDTCWLYCQWTEVGWIGLHTYNITITSSNPMFQWNKVMYVPV